MGLRLRSIRARDESLLLPPPLPLIQLPAETRLARTGLPGERPIHLPVRRHLECQGLLQMERPPPEPILVENCLLLDAEESEYEALEVVSRLAVYEYNRPEVYQYSGAPDDTLVFDSLFESGNLQRAERVFRSAGELGFRQHHESQEYDLVIHPDVKNGAYRQWFYFEVRNGVPGVSYRFSLVNLAKSGALFGCGLQPVVYSERNAELRQQGWVHAGTHVRYGPREVPSSLSSSEIIDGSPTTISNALSFQYCFEHENDCVYFACIQPYTYTDLVEYLERLEKDPERAQICRRTELCQTIAQNSCDLLTITSPGKHGLPQEERQIIVLSARVHPGEPNSSWMMKGMIDYLTGNSAGATVLRQNFVFKVVPMLNPDGVINGNTRVNLAGWDLNRKWASPVEKLFPTVYHLKRLLTSYQSRGRVAIYCDLHGHSINRNIFTYGCYSRKVTVASSAMTEDPHSRIKHMKGDPRVFPMIVARHSSLFSFASCDFKVQKSKLTTARVVVHHELGVTNSYTLEASFCGPDFGPRKDTQFSTWDLEDMGRSWCQSLIVYFDLVTEVKELELEREREMQQERIKSNPKNDETELISELLEDYEAALSELFAQSQLENEEEDFDQMPKSGYGTDSDLSDAEEEPIPPSVNCIDQGLLLKNINPVAGDPDGHEGGGEGKVTRKKKANKKKRSRGRTSKQSKKTNSDGKSKPKKKKRTRSKRRIADEDTCEPGFGSDSGMKSNRRKTASTQKASRSKSLRAMPSEVTRVLPISVADVKRLQIASEVFSKGMTSSPPSAITAILSEDSPLVLPNVIEACREPRRRLRTAPAKYRGEVPRQICGDVRLELPALTRIKRSRTFDYDNEFGDDDRPDDEVASDGEADVSDGNASDASAQSEPLGPYEEDF